MRVPLGFANAPSCSSKVHAQVFGRIICLVLGTTLISFNNKYASNQRAISERIGELEVTSPDSWSLTAEEHTQNGIFPSAIHLWNQLPESIVKPLPLMSSRLG